MARVIITDSKDILNGRIRTILRAGGKLQVLDELFADSEIKYSERIQRVGAVATGKNYTIRNIDVQGVKYRHYKLG